LDPLEPSPPYPRRKSRLWPAGVLLAAVLAIAGSASARSTSRGATPSTPGQTFRGELVLAHADNFATRKSTYRPMLRLANGRSLALDLADGLPPGATSGRSVVVHGSSHGNTIAVGRGTGAISVAASGGSTSSATSSVTTTAVTGTRRVAVVLFNFSNDASQPYTPAFADGIAFTNPDSVAGYYAASSWGRLTLTGDVFGWYTIPDTNTSCNYSAWADSATKAASTAGVNLGAYDNVVFAFPQASSCNWSGLGEMPGRRAWLNGDGSTGGMTLRGTAHELGHNFGTHHASSLSCAVNGVKVSLAANPANCTTSEYGDPFSVMGSATRYEQSNVARGNFGWLQPANTRQVTVSGDYALKPIELNDATAVQVLTIQRTPSTYLTLEFRQPDPTFDTFSPSDYAVNGVTIRIAAGPDTITQSQLVDATPGSVLNFFDAALAAGKTLTDPLSGVSITTLSAGPAGATVRVAFGGASGGGAPDTTPPSVPGSLQATATGTSTVALSWAASTDDVGVTGYRVYRGSTLVATVTGTGYTDSGLAAGTTYGYQVVAVDAAGNASAAASVTGTTSAAPPADTSAPSAPASLVAAYQPKTTRKVGLTWAASTDNVGVAGYRVYRNGSLVATTASRSYTDSLPAKVAKPGYYVVAYDAAGNASAASNTASP